MKLSFLLVLVGLPLASVLALIARQEIDQDLNLDLLPNEDASVSNDPIPFWQRDLAQIKVEAALGLTSKKHEFSTMSRMVGELEIRRTAKISTHYTKEGKIPYVIWQTMTPAEPSFREIRSTRKEVESTGTFDPATGRITETNVSARSR